MPDILGRTLRDGADRVAGTVGAPPAQLVRARGDQRRRRRTATSAALAFVLVLSGGGAAWALSRPGHPVSRPQPPAVSASATPHLRHTGAPHPHSSAPGSSVSSPPVSTSPAAGTKALQLGPLTLQVPQTWRITFHDTKGDYTVSTGSCTGASDLLEAWTGSPCPSFSLITDAAPTDKYPTPTPENYTPWGQYLPTGGSPGGCPGKDFPPWERIGPDDGKPFDEGYAPVSTSKTADYVVWQYGCQQVGHTTPASYFKECDWYLPVSKILIVDEYSIPGLAQVLATAAWQQP